MSRLARIAADHRVLSVAIIVLFLVLAIVLTRPVIVKGHNSTVGDPYDPTFHAWTIAWDVHALFTNPLNLFNANIFYPNRYTLAYSEHEFTNGILSIPFILTTDNPLQSANYVLILNFLISALGAYLLVLYLTKNRVAGVVGGIAYAFAPYMFSHITQLSICSCGWIPFTILFLHRYTQEKKTRDAFLFALFFLLQFLSNTYIGLFLFIGIVVFLVVRLIRDRKTFTLRWVLILVAAAVCALLVLLPFALPYLKVNKENPKMERKIGEVDAHSADVQDFLVAPSFNWLWGNLSSGLRAKTFDRGGPNHRALFPGLAIFALGVAGAWYLFKKGRGEERFYFWYYVVLLGTSALFCLGTSLYLFGRRLSIPMPYDLLYHLVPGFKALRVPTVFAMLTTLAFAVLSGFAVKWILSAASSKRGTRGAVIASVVIMILLLVDVMTISLPMWRVPVKSEFPEVYSWLKEQKGDAPTVELPLPVGTGEWLDWESQRTYFSTLHWKKIFNGFSSFVPNSYTKAQKLCEDFPSAECMKFFKKERLEFVIVHSKVISVRQLKDIEEWDEDHDDFDLVKKFDADYVYRLE